jgi:hypothetical protein
MLIESSVSGRACLIQWQNEITVTSIFALLGEIHRVRLLAGEPLIVILHIDSAIRTPGPHVLDSLKAGLASVIGVCDQLLVALEGESVDRLLLRAAFANVATASITRGPRVFASLHAALLHAQRFAPHDVLELQRRSMRDSLPPGRR